VSCWVSREQVVHCLRERGWKYSDGTPRVELYKRPGSAQRIDIQRRDVFPELQIRALFKQAGLTKVETDAFLRTAVKSEPPPGKQAR
jgi:hypothetical protein